MRPPGPIARLTPRQQDVATLVAYGLTNKAVAAELGLSVRVVETHIEHIATKWQLDPARNRRVLIARIMLGIAA